MRSDRQSESFHHFHSFAVKDRVDFTSLSDDKPKPPSPTSIKNIMETILPSEADDYALKDTFKIYIARALINNCNFFNKSF